jgi:hypothetical protein
MGEGELRAIAHEKGGFSWEEESSEPSFKRWKGLMERGELIAICS